MRISVAFGVGMLVSTAGAAEPTAKELNNEMQRQAKSTQIVLVADFQGEPTSYGADAKPETLEIVFLPEGKGPSQVAQAGQVILLSESASDEEQQNLIASAFKQRARLALSEP